jgi:hypothetical protein
MRLVTGAGLVANKVASYERDKIRMAAGRAVASTSANTTTTSAETTTATATIDEENDDGYLHVRDPQGNAGKMDDQKYLQL